MTTTYTVWVRRFRGHWTFYGECTETELHSEIVHIRACGLAVRIGARAPQE